MKIIKTFALDILYSRPRVFDVLKRGSRALGVRSKLFDSIRRFKKKNPNASVLQVGANDGVVNDPLREHILTSNWKCILVEPVPYLFARLEKNYSWVDRVKCLNAAVSDSTYESDFFYLNEQSLRFLPRWASQIGSFSVDHIRKHLGDGSEDWISIQKLKGVTIADLLERAGVADFDLIHLDVEGFEARLIKSFFQAGQSPKALLYESHHLGGEKAEIESLLRSLDYRLESHGMDTLALR